MRAIVICTLRPLLPPCRGRRYELFGPATQGWQHGGSFLGIRKRKKEFLPRSQLDASAGYTILDGERHAGPQPVHAPAYLHLQPERATTPNLDHLLAKILSRFHLDIDFHRPPRALDPPNNLVRGPVAHALELFRSYRH